MTSPLSTARWEGVRALGDIVFRVILAWLPAVEDTHTYLEVLGATITGLSFRGNFLAGVLLPAASKREPPVETPAFETDVGEAVTALPAGEELELACLGPTPATVWLFTHVNLDFFIRGVLTWPWLV